MMNAAATTRQRALRPEQHGPVYRQLLRAAQVAAHGPFLGFSRPYVLVDNFLPPLLLEEFTRFVVARQARFQASSVLGTTHSKTPVLALAHRRSRVLYELCELRLPLELHILAVLPAVLRELGMPPFRASAIEAQITTTNDQEFFRPHTDNGSGPVQDREVSFTCFIHREPAAFVGGELRIDGGMATGPYRIVPKRNRIVFFLSGALHEITPVTCPSRRFADGRFTVNGWIHRSQVHAQACQSNHCPDR